MTKDNTKKITVACPRCQKKFDYYSSLFRPFCCERCKLIDFGQWMNETYKVPLKNDPNKENEFVEQDYEEDQNQSEED